MTLAVRTLDPGDAEASRRLGHEAFGIPPVPSGEPARLDRPGARYVGAYDGRVLAARAVDRAFDCWFGGVPVPTAGIAEVTVATEYRGQQALRPLLSRTLAEAQERGAVVSTLFPTASRIYRGLGYEVITDLLTVRVPTWVLATVSRPASVTLRRAAAGDDVTAIRTVYDRWAAAQNGPLTRRGPSFDAAATEMLGEVTGVTLAEHDGEVVGYVSWRRGEGYGESATLEIGDLLATTADGYRALLAAMGSNSAVTASTTIRTSGHDLVRTFLPTLHWQTVDAKPYMLAILDVPGALTVRRYAAGFSAELPFRVVGGFAPGLDGGYRLEVTAEAAHCERIDPVDGPTFTPQGLALLYAGTVSAANLRVAGHLTGGRPTDDLTWDALFGGQQPHIRDFF